MGLYEMMVMTPDLRKAVAAETDLDGLRDRAFREGMKPLRISGAMKIAAGLTTVDEVMTVAPPPGGDRRHSH
jgi:general secretion pathway protein E